MTLTDKLVLAIIAVACAVVVALIPGAPKHPCGVAEFSPDVPTQVKEQCRQHRRVKT